MNHLEAFTSEDGKRGREWTSEDYNDRYRRNGDELQVFIDNKWSVSHIKFDAAMKHKVRWADEPKTLTPGNYIMRMKPDGLFDIQCGDGTWCDARELGVVIEQIRPSQPAEPQPEYPLSYAEAKKQMIRGYWAECDIHDLRMEYMSIEGDEFISKNGTRGAVRRLFEHTAGYPKLEAASWRIVGGGGK